MTKKPKKGAQAAGDAPEGSRKTLFKAGRKPHNVPPPKQYDSLHELVKVIGSQPRTVFINGKSIEMSLAERTLRLQVNRALEGKVRDVAHILRLMMKYPNLAKSYKEKKVILMCGAFANV